MHQHEDFSYFMLFEVDESIIVISAREVIETHLRVTHHVLNVISFQAFSCEYFVESLLFCKAPQFFENVIDAIFQCFFHF